MFCGLGDRHRDVDQTSAILLAKVAGGGGGKGGNSVKARASIKMREIDPSHVKETNLTCSVVIN